MIREELNELYWLKKENEDLENRLKELEETNGIGAVKITDNKKSSNSSVNDLVQQVAFKKIQLKNKINENNILILEEIIEIEKFIEKIPDSELRTIIRLRNIDLKTWEEIAEKTGVGRKTVSKKYNNFIQDLKRYLNEKMQKDIDCPKIP